MLVVVGEHGGVTVAQPQAGGLFPGLAEPHRLGQANVAEAVGEQGHAAAVGHGLQLAGVPGQDQLPSQTTLAPGWPDQRRAPAARPPAPETRKQPPEGKADGGPALTRDTLMRI
jgi:hypothetical protein